MFYIYFTDFQMDSNYILNETNDNKLESIINELAIKNDLPMIRLIRKHNSNVNQLHPCYINHKHHIPGH